MCRRVECRKCGRPTFAGCGAHVESVLRDVPTKDRCQGHTDEAKGEPFSLKDFVGKLFSSKK